MKRILFTLMLAGLMLTGNPLNAQQVVRVVNYDQLDPIIHRQDSVLYVVNFWATWCAPCVKELPEFMEVNKMMHGQQNFKMILVSLDNAKQMDTKVRPFLKVNGIPTDVYLLDDNKRMNYWIGQIYNDWSGTIPATALIRNGKVVFFKEEQLNKEELQKAIVQYL